MFLKKLTKYLENDIEKYMDNFGVTVEKQQI